jgi:8-oxo-dGTP pyrophosphatase MutT (NUDIX family)
MSLPCIDAARRFDAPRHLPFTIDAVQVGWIRRRDVALLASWPDVFECDAAQVRLAPHFDTLELRSAALASVIGALAAQGHIVGWRDETYAIRNSFDAPPLALIERAAARFFGTTTYAAHVNGLVVRADQPPLVWIARRSLDKPTDPGMLDNLVGGGIGWGYTVREALLKECWEESGIPPEVAQGARAGGTLHVLQELPEGTQAEQLFVFDLELGEDFTPRNQDGEVSEHRLARVDEVRTWLASGQMTVDASLAMLDALLRAGLADAGEFPGMAALYRAPA